MDEITHNAASSRFEITIENSEVPAIAEYIREPGLLTVTHVIVPEEARGAGVASALAARLVDLARAEGLKVRPQCAFMAAYLKRHPEHNDLLG